MYPRVVKYKLNFLRVQSILVHADAEIIAIKVHDNDPYLYCTVSGQSEEQVWRQIMMIETDSYIDPAIAESMFYIDTVEDFKGIVFHAFGRDDS